MATYSATFSGRPACVLYIDITETSTNPGSNQSTVSFTLRVVGNSASFNGFAGSWNITVNGVPYNGSWTYDFRVDNTVTLTSGTQVVTHNADGSKSIDVSGTATDGNGGTPLGTATIGTQSFALTDFSFPPSAPAAPTATLNSDRQGITVVSAVASSVVTPSSYEYRSSSNGGSSWSSAILMGPTPDNRTAVLTSITPAATYIFQTRAISSEGTGAWSTSSAGVFVTSGGRRWDGTNWTPTATAKRWDGTQWVIITTAKRWDGTSWTNLN